MKTLKNTASLIITTLQDSDFVKQNAASTNKQTPHWAILEQKSLDRFKNIFSVQNKKETPPLAILK